MDRSDMIAWVDPAPFPISGCDEAIRFVWLRSFHPWVSIRVERSGRDVLLTSHVRPLSATAGASTSHVSEISAAELDALRADVERALAEESHTPDRDRDGSEWVLEAVSARGLTRVARRSPRDGALREVGLWLLQLASVDASPLY